MTSATKSDQNGPDSNSKIQIEVEMVKDRVKEKKKHDRTFIDRILLGLIIIVGLMVVRFT
jgi:hypothetical protein